MIYSNSLRFREAGSPFNTPVTAEQDHLSARHSRTGITALLPQLSAAAEFLVVNLIAQHDPESDPEFASGGGLCFPQSFLHQFAPVEAFQVRISSHRVYRCFTSEIAHQSVAFLAQLPEPLPASAGAFTGD